MLDAGVYPLVSKAISSKTVLHVKLTDSVIECLEKYKNQKGKKGATLEFKGKTGSLCLPSEMSENKSVVFRFILNETETDQNNQTVSRINKDKQFEQVGAVGTDVMRFQATGDSFSKVEHRFRNIQGEKEKQSSVLLPNLINIKLDRKLNSKLNISNNVTQKRKYSGPTSSFEANCFKKARQHYKHSKPMEKLKLNAEEDKTKSTYSHNYPPTPTVADQGYETDNEPSNLKTQTSDGDKNDSNQYKLIYNDINTDFLVKYKAITSDQQRTAYKKYFNLDYQKYLKMHSFLEERYSRFFAFGKQFQKETSTLKKCLTFMDMAESSSYKSYVTNFKYLHEKLRYLKFCVNDYDSTNTL